MMSISLICLWPSSASWQHKLEERAAIILKPGYFKDRIQRLGNLLTSEIDFDKFDLKTGLLGLTGIIKGSPNAREQIRKMMEPDTGNLLKAANDLISEAVVELGKKSYKGLVILVDDLDKMVVRPLAHANCSRPLTFHKPGGAVDGI